MAICNPGPRQNAPLDFLHHIREVNLTLRLAREALAKVSTPSGGAH
jgi:hypothetical protein